MTFLFAVVYMLCSCSAEESSEDRKNSLDHPLELKTVQRCFPKCDPNNIRMTEGGWNMEFCPTLELLNKNYQGMSSRDPSLNKLSGWLICTPSLRTTALGLEAMSVHGAVQVTGKNHIFVSVQLLTLRWSWIVTSFSPGLSFLIWKIFQVGSQAPVCPSSVTRLKCSWPDFLCRASVNS